MKVGAIIGRLPNVDTMVTKEEVTKELYNQGELRRTITITLKGRDLKASATIVGKRATCPGIDGLRKIMLKAMRQHPKRRWRMNGMQMYCVS